MFNLSSLFSNDKMKDMALGMLKKQMKEGNIRLVTIEMNEGGELELQMYNAGREPVLVERERLDTIQSIMEDQDAEIERLRNERNVLLSAAPAAEIETPNPNQLTLELNGNDSETAVG